MRPFKRLRRAGEHVHVDQAFVLLFPDPGMDDQLGHGVLPEHGEQRRKLFRTVHADPGLHGNPEIRHHPRSAVEHIVQEVFEKRRFREEARALFLCHDGARGAAQIQVHLAVAEIIEQLRRFQEILSPVGQDLRHHRDAAVVLRQYVPPVPLRDADVRPRGKKGRVIAVDARKNLMEGVPEHKARDAFHRRKIYLLYHIELTVSSSGFLRAAGVLSLHFS